MPSPTLCLEAVLDSLWRVGDEMVVQQYHETGGVGAPLRIGCLKARRCHHARAHHQQTEAFAARLVVLLDHHLVADPPQGIENRLEMIQSQTSDDANPHSGPSLFDHHRKLEVIVRRARQRLRVGA